MSGICLRLSSGLQQTVLAVKAAMSEKIEKMAKVYGEMRTAFRVDGCLFVK